MNDVVKKNVIQTVAHGYDLKDGEMARCSYVILGQYTNDKRLEQTVRRDHPKFVLTEWTTVKYTYTMDLRKFMENANVAEVREI